MDSEPLIVKLYADFVCCLFFSRNYETVDMRLFQELSYTAQYECMRQIYMMYAGSDKRAFYSEDHAMLHLCEKEDPHFLQGHVTVEAWLKEQEIEDGSEDESEDESSDDLPE